MSRSWRLQARSLLSISPEGGGRAVRPLGDGRGLPRPSAAFCYAFTRCLDGRKQGEILSDAAAVLFRIDRDRRPDATGVATVLLEEGRAGRLADLGVFGTTPLFRGPADEDGRSIVPLPTDGRVAVGLSPKGGGAAVVVVDADAGTEARRIPLAPIGKGGEGGLIGFSPDGTLLAGWRRRELAAEAARLAEARAAAEAERLAADEAARVFPGALTRQEFLDALREGMSRGRFAAAACYALYDGDSFRTRFGPPDRDASWTDGERLCTYVCLDGFVRLTVRPLPNGILIITAYDLL